MKRMYKWLVALLILCIALPLVSVALDDSEYSAVTTGDATVTFGPNKANEQVEVKSVYLTHGENGTLKFYAVGGEGRQTPSGFASTTNITVPNTDWDLTNSDTVVYYDTSTDIGYYRTINASTTNSITIDSAMSGVSTGATAIVGDQIYEMSQQAQIDYKTTRSLSSITNDASYTVDDPKLTVLNGPQTIFISPVDSPVYIVANQTDEAATTNLTMTVLVVR